VCHRCRRHAHRRADHDRARARVDDHASRRVAGLDLDRFERREIGNALTGIGRGLYAHRHRIHRSRRILAKQLVDAFGETRGRREVRRIQIQHDVRLGREVRRNRALDRRAVRHATGARNVQRDARAVFAGHAEATDDEAALPDRVDLAVDTTKRRHQEAAAAQAAGVADRIDGDVDRLSGLRKRRQVGTHRHRRNVLQLRIHVRRNRDTELREHVANALDRERRLAGLVARAVEADDEAVTDELVAAHARHRGEIFHAFRVSACRGKRESERRQGIEQNGECLGHCRLRTAGTAG
jgi:hypothetical protein